MVNVGFALYGWDEGLGDDAVDGDEFTGIVWLGETDLYVACSSGDEVA